EVCAEGIRKTVWRFLREPFEKRLEFRVSALHRYAGPDLERHAVTRVGVERELERHVNIRLTPSKARRHHADDLIRLAYQLDGSPDDVGIAGVISLPELVSEDYDAFRLLSGGSVRRDQPAAHQSGCSPVMRSVRSDVTRLDILGKIAVGGGEIPSIF